MTEEEKNVEILTEAYRLWNDTKADCVGHWLDLIDDNVDWRSLADGAPGMEFTVCCSGKDGAIAYMQALGAGWELIHYTVDEFIAQGDRVVMVGNCGWRNKATRKEIETPKVDILRMEGGKIVGFFELYDTAKAIAATQLDD